MDLYHPDLPGRHPAALLVHGGGWAFGSRRDLAMTGMARFLADAGFVVAAFDHRTWVFGGRFADAVDDTRAALKWLAAIPDVDPARISVVGVGAGAAAAAVAADTPHRLVCAYGPYDFSSLPFGRLGALAWVGETHPARLAWRSPTNACITPSPVLLLHGLRDRVVPVRHAEALAARRVARGLPVQMHLLEDVGHGFLDHPGLAVWDDAAGALLSFLIEPGP